MGGMKVAEGEEEFGRPEPGPRPETGAPSASSGVTFHRVAIGVALAAAFCVAATVYFLLTTPVPGVRIPLNAWLGVAGGVFAGLAWVVLVKLSPKLVYAKPGQGRWARGSAYVGFGLLAAFGAVALFHLPGLDSKWFGGEAGLWSRTLIGKEFVLRPVFFPAAAVFLGVMVAFHLYVNRPNSAEFLVETQGEMKRVSWPTRREWIGSTIVVLVLVAVLSLFLFGADTLLSELMQTFKIGF